MWAMDLNVAENPNVYIDILPSIVVWWIYLFEVLDFRWFMGHDMYLALLHIKHVSLYIQIDQFASKCLYGC